MQLISSPNMFISKVVAATAGPTSLKHKGNEGHYTVMEEEWESADGLETIKRGAGRSAAERDNQSEKCSLNGRS